MSLPSASTTDGSRTFYKRLGPTAPLRDVPLKVDPNPVASAFPGHVSDAIWNVVLADPEKAGLEGIHHLADRQMQGFVAHQDPCLRLRGPWT